MLIRHLSSCHAFDLFLISFPDLVSITLSYPRQGLMSGLFSFLLLFYPVHISCFWDCMIPFDVDFLRTTR